MRNRWPVAILAAAGGKNIATQEIRTVTVTDGQPNLDFTVVVSSAGVVSAIEVIER